MKKYSATTRGFNSNQPDDVEITDEYSQQLLREESEGKEIYPDENGYPRTRDPIYTDDELSVTARIIRDRKLTASDYTQLDDSPRNKAAWKIHRQHLRDITYQPNFPHDIVWGEVPE